MTISEVSEKYGLPADTLRYYEKVGLIPPYTEKKAAYGITRRKTAAGWNLSNVCAGRGCLSKR